MSTSNCNELINPDAYELMVKSLLEAKLRRTGLGTFESYHLKKYKGKSGQEHEIDVSFEIKVGDLELLFLAECKKYQRRVGVDDIMAFSYRMKDIGAHKGLLVTTHGFQAGVTTIAKSERIALLVAAKGRIIKTWVGLVARDFTYWISSFLFEVSEDGLDRHLIGQRYISCNQTWEAESLDYYPLPGDTLFFLIPEEEIIEQTEIQPNRRAGEITASILQPTERKNYLD
jgi:hypothetical protein